jgi:DNA-binding NarL/FixJ family response regulator
VAAYAAHGSALAAHDGPALLAVADEMAAIGANAYALDAAVGAARQFLSEGRADSARRAAIRARELYAPDQGATFPPIDGLDGVATDLTPREAQIAALAARGLSNQEIADQLVLSVRTVETYVYRAMQKRGVDNRHDL